MSYWTAYFLANYPVEYMAALLSSVSDDPEKLHQYLEEAVRIGIDILPPDINVSGEGFTADGQGLRYGLASIKGVGKAATDAIISGRPYSSIYDFLLRVDGAAFNSGTLVALASVGTFDSLHMCRHHLVQWLETAHGESKAIRDNIGDGQYPLVSPREPSLLLSSDVRNRETALYQEWERSYLGVEVSTATVYVDVAGPLTYNDLTVVNETIRHHQGRSPVVVSFNGVELKDYGKVQYSEKLKNSLEAIPRIKVELR